MNFTKEKRKLNLSISGGMVSRSGPLHECYLISRFFWFNNGERRSITNYDTAQIP